MASFSRKSLLTYLCVCILLWLGIRYLVPVVLPFLLAGITALSAEPSVRVLQHRLRLPRPAAAGIGVVITLSVLILSLMVLGALLVRQVRVLADKMPDLGQSATQGMESLRLLLSDIADNAPPGIRDMAKRSVEGFFSDGNILLDQATSLVTSLASGVVSRLPQSAFSIGTWLLASFMLSSKLPSIRKWAGDHAPEQWHKTYRPALARIKRSVLGWLKAQLKLMSVTFGILTLGFFLLRVEDALLRAAVIALVDALPVFGTGLIMIPWGIIHLAQGDTVLGVGLLAIYAAAALSRSILEPKFVGKQLGLDPLITLIAIYTGYRLWGIPGLLFAPLLTVTAIQFLSAGKEA